MLNFEIFYDDLNEEAQARLLETFETTVDAENWEIIPLAIVDREDEEDEDVTDRLIEIQKQNQKITNGFENDEEEYRKIINERIMKFEQT